MCLHKFVKLVTSSVSCKTVLHLANVCFSAQAISQPCRVQTVDQGSPTFLKLRATSCVPIQKLKILLNLPSIILLLIFVNCEDIDHANFIFRIGPRATHVVREGDLVPAGTTLGTPAVDTRPVKRLARAMRYIHDIKF